MTRMTGIILMGIGLLSFIIGALFFFKTDKKPVNVDYGRELENAIEMAIADGVLTTNERKLIEQLAIEKELDLKDIIADVENRISESITDSETEIIDYNKKNGNDFEKFIVQKFSKDFYTIKEWAGDKYINGVYAKTTPQPDILLELNLNGKTYQLSVECKWRKNLYKGGIEIATVEQLERYRIFQEGRKIPVFIAIGLGGKGISPEQLFIVPLDEIAGNFIHLDKLKKFEKNIKKNFYYDIDSNELR